MENFDSLFTPKGNAPARQFSPIDKQAWAEKKQVERKTVYEMIDNTAEEMCQDSELFQLGLDIMARFDRYSVGNVLLIAKQMPEATKLADFDTWKQSRVYVRKGEDHIKLLVPGEEFTREDGSPGVNYNVKHVFDISQTNSRSKPAQVNYDMRLLLKSMLRNAPCVIEIGDKVPDGVGAFYHPDDHKIYVLQGMDGPDIFRALSQELAHAHMDKGHNYNRSNHAFTAYCCAYTLCKRFGVDTKGFTFPDLPESITNKGAQGIRTELGMIRDCANQISMDMSRVLNRSQKERGEGAR